MKYLMIIALFLLASCSTTKRAGSFYDPAFYEKLQAQRQKTPIIKEGSMTKQYHSALGSLCTHYYSDLKNTNSLICDNGNYEKKIRILQ
ncbi:MAG: hypothetical protein ACJARD_000879 [Alphaproteobacteria bacterium]|jgi:hypothetical protein